MTPKPVVHSAPTAAHNLCINFLSREVEKLANRKGSKRKGPLTDEQLRERKRGYDRRYRDERPHMVFYSTSRYNAKKDGAFSDLTQEDARDIYESPNVCAYCGKDHGEDPPPRAIHIDHIIPMKQGGYNSRWNLTKVCGACNTSKKTMSLIAFRNRTPAFTQERYDAVVAGMAQLSGKTPDEIARLLEQSHAFEIAFQAERERMEAMLAA